MSPTASIQTTMPKYDINNHTHLEIMSAEFDMYSHDDWDEYVELAEKRNMHYKSINVLRSAGKKAGLSKYLSPKVINWVLELVDELDEDPKEEK